MAMFRLSNANAAPDDSASQEAAMEKEERVLAFYSELVRCALDEDFDGRYRGIASRRRQTWIAHLVGSFGAGL